MNRRREIELRVEKLLKDRGVDSIPIKVQSLAQAEGLEVVHLEMKADVSGALIKSRTGTAIAINASHAPTRQRFTIAHELGHHILAHKADDHIDWHFTVLRRDSVSSDAVDDQEIEANFFAASLLMPKAFLMNDVREQIGFGGELKDDDATIEQLAGKYRVSPSAMRYRLINLALLRPY